MRRAIWALTVAVSLSTCTTDPYPMPSGTPHAGQSNPAQVGHPVTAVLIYLQVRPGDRLELLGAEPVDPIDGATLRFLVSRPVVHPDGRKVIGEEFEDLAGAVVSATPLSSGHTAYDNTIGIVGELTAHRPGRFEVHSLRVRYRLNGGGEQVGEGTQVVWLVCADDPAPSDCPDAPI